MTFYEEIESYLIGGFHVGVEDVDDKRFVIVSPFRDLNGDWAESTWCDRLSESEKTIGGNSVGSHRAFWSSGNFRIIRIYKPEELNPKFKRYEVGNDVVTKDGREWQVTKVGPFNTYFVGSNDYLTQHEVPHYDLLPYIEKEEDVKVEAEIPYLSSTTGELEESAVTIKELGEDEVLAPDGVDVYKAITGSDYKRGREDMLNEILGDAKEELTRVVGIMALSGKNIEPSFINILSRLLSRSEEFEKDEEVSALVRELSKEDKKDEDILVGEGR